jgi:hypothetical protein
MNLKAVTAKVPQSAVAGGFKGFHVLGAYATSSPRFGN